MTIKILPVAPPCTLLTPITHNSQSTYWSESDWVWNWWYLIHLPFNASEIYKIVSNQWHLIKRYWSTAVMFYYSKALTGLRSLIQHPSIYLYRLWIIMKRDICCLWPQILGKFYLFNKNNLLQTPIYLLVILNWCFYSFVLCYYVILGFITFCFSCACYNPITVIVWLCYKNIFT